MKQIFIINGSGGVGKDEFINIMVEQFKEKCEIGNYSSVSKVKEIAKLIGWNGAKTERDRKFLSDLKLLTTAYNDMPLNDMSEFADNFMIFNLNFPRVLFLHIREPEEIEKAVKKFEKYSAKTILVKRDSVKHITSNMADENVFNYDYDIVINNNGSLEDLTNKVVCFFNDFFNNSLKKEY
jgi:hypothetical protein